jgi:hypothetical protein
LGSIERNFKYRSMPDQPITPSEPDPFLKQLLETAAPVALTPFLDTLVNAQILLDRLEPPGSKPDPLMSIAYLNLTVMAHNLGAGSQHSNLGRADETQRTLIGENSEHGGASR